MIGGKQLKKFVVILILLAFNMVLFSCSSKTDIPQYQSEILFNNYKPNSSVELEMVLSVPTAFMYPSGRKITFLYSDNSIETGDYYEEISDRHSFQNCTWEEKKQMSELCNNALKILNHNAYTNDLYDDYLKMPDMVLLLDGYGYVIISDSENWHHIGKMNNYQSKALFYVYDIETEQIVYAQKFIFFNYCVFSGHFYYEA